MVLSCFGSVGSVNLWSIVDDMIGYVRIQTIRNGWTLWRLFADLCGWRVPDAKFPPPAKVLTVLGAEYDPRLFPHWQMIIRISERRSHVLSTSLLEILESGRPRVKQHGDGGKLQHASSMLRGKYGAAKSRSFVRRQRETNTTHHFACATSLSFEMVATCVAHEREPTGDPE